MPRYLYIQRSRPGKGEAPSAARMEEMYARLNAWREKFQDNLVDTGGKLSSDQFESRLPDVNRVLYLLFTESYLSSYAETAIRRELCDEALRLTRSRKPTPCWP